MLAILSTIGPVLSICQLGNILVFLAGTVRIYPRCLIVHPYGRVYRQDQAWKAYQCQSALPNRGVRAPHISANTTTPLFARSSFCPVSYDSHLIPPGLTLVPPVDEVNRSELTGNGAAGEADKPNAVFQGCLVDPSASIDEPQVLHQPVQDHISPAHYIAGPLYCGSLNN